MKPRHLQTNCSLSAGFLRLCLFYCLRTVSTPALPASSCDSYHATADRWHLLQAARKSHRPRWPTTGCRRPRDCGCHPAGRTAELLPAPAGRSAWVVLHAGAHGEDLDPQMGLGITEPEGRSPGNPTGDAFASLRWTFPSYLGGASVSLDGPEPWPSVSLSDPTSWCFSRLVTP